MPALQLEPAPFRRPEPFRTVLPARRTKPRALPSREATHDFLVPNPRPDLTTDAVTLRMLARG